MSNLYCLKSGYFCAGIEINENDVCINAAPILHWCLGKKLVDIEKKSKSLKHEMFLVTEEKEKENILNLFFTKK